MISEPVTNASSHKRNEVLLRAPLAAAGDQGEGSGGQVVKSKWSLSCCFSLSDMKPNSKILASLGRPFLSKGTVSGRVAINTRPALPVWPQDWHVNIASGEQGNRCSFPQFAVGWIWLFRLHYVLKENCRACQGVLGRFFDGQLWASYVGEAVAWYILRMNEILHHLSEPLQ